MKPSSVSTSDFSVPGDMSLRKGQNQSHYARERGEWDAHQVVIDIEHASKFPVTENRLSIE